MKNLVLGLILGSSLTGFGIQFDDYASSHGLDASRVLGDLQANHAQDLQNLPVVEMILGDRFSVPSINLLAMNFSDKQTLLQQQLQDLGTGNALTDLLGVDDQKAIAGLNPEQTVLAQNLLMVLESKLADLLIQSPTPLVMPSVSSAPAVSPASPDHGGVAGAVPPAVLTEIPAAVTENPAVKSAAASLKGKEDDLAAAQAKLTELQNVGAAAGKIAGAASAVKAAQTAVKNAKEQLNQVIAEAQKPAATTAATGPAASNAAPVSVNNFIFTVDIPLAVVDDAAVESAKKNLLAAEKNLQEAKNDKRGEKAIGLAQARFDNAKKKLEKAVAVAQKMLEDTVAVPDPIRDAERAVQKAQEAVQNASSAMAKAIAERNLKKAQSALAELQGSVVTAVPSAADQEEAHRLLDRAKKLQTLVNNKELIWRALTRPVLDKFGRDVLAFDNKLSNEDVVGSDIQQFMSQVKSFEDRIKNVPDGNALLDELSTNVAMVPVTAMSAMPIAAPASAPIAAPAPAPAAITSQPAMASITPAVASVPVAAPVVPASASAQSGSTSVMAVPVPAPAPAYVPALNPTVSQGGYVPTASTFPSVTLTPVEQAQMQELAIDQALIDQVENYNVFKVQDLLKSLNLNNLTDDQLRELYLIKRRLDPAYTGNKMSGFESRRLRPWLSKIDEWIARQHAQKAE